MYIFKSIGKAISNSFTATTDTVRGITDLSVDVITDNPITRTMCDVRLLGKTIREEKQAKSLHKKLVKLQLKQAELTVKADSDF